MAAIGPQNVARTIAIADQFQEAGFIFFHPGFSVHFPYVGGSIFGLIAVVEEETMKVIHVEKSDAAYRIFITEGDQGMAQDAQAIGTEQLKKALGQFGAS